MECPKCLEKTRVKSTNKEYHEGVQRYRRCSACNFGFITMETVQQLGVNNSYDSMTIEVGHTTKGVGHTTN